MNRQNKIYEPFRLSCFITLLIIIFSIGTTSPTFADSRSGGSTSLPKAPKSSNTSVKASSLVTIFVSGKSYFTLDEAAFSNGAAGRYVFFTWTFHNYDNISFQMNDYFMRLTNRSGTPFSVKLLPQDKSKNKVPAQGSMQLHYYAKVSDSTGWSDLVVKLIQWNFSAELFEKTLWKFSIPQTYSMATPVQLNRKIFSDGGTLQAGVTEFVMNRAADHSEAFLTLAMQNIGDHSMELPGYSYSLETKDDRSYPLQVANQPDVHLTPLFANQIQLVGSLPKDVDLSASKLVVTQNDDVLKLRVPIAAFMLPSPSSGAPITAVGSNRTMALPASGTSVTMAIKKVDLNGTDESYHASVFFTIKNIGQKSASVPNYNYAIQTPEGNIYTLDPTVAKDLVIASAMEKELKFDIAVPIFMQQNGWTLLLTQEDTVNKVTLPIGAYELPEFKDFNAGALGNEYALTDRNHTLSAKLTALQRLPWNDQDIITAEITLKNTGSTTVALPHVQGYFLLDDKVKVEATLYPMDNAISLNAQASTSSIFYAKIPFVTSLSQIKLVLQEKDDAQVVHTLAEFSDSSANLRIPSLALGQSYPITEVGKLSELSLSSTHTYTGVEDNLYYAEIAVKNLEQRVVSGSSWSGYLKTQNGIYYPITLTNPSSAINPGASSVIAVWGILPSGIQMSQLSLLIGRSVPGIPTAGAVPVSADAFVKAVEMPMPTEVLTLQSLNALQISPFMINISNNKSQINSQSFTYSFDYTLTKNPNPAHSPNLSAGSNHKLVLQLSDSQGQSYEHTIPLDAPSGLSVGSGNYSFTKTDSDLFFLSKIQLAHQYTLKIYDEFQGYRLLLTAQTYNWIS